MLIVQLILFIIFHAFEVNPKFWNSVRLPSSYKEWVDLTPTSKIENDSFYVRPFVETAINDFLKRKDASKSDVFSIGISEYKNNISDVIKLSVFPQDSLWRFLLSNADSLGTKEISISYIEIDNKLFYWDVNDSYLSPEVYDILIKYDFIERRNVPTQGWLVGERGHFDDGNKINQYYFCKTDPIRFKRTYSVYYKPPQRIKCKCN